SKVDLTVDGYWKDRDQSLKVTKIAAMSLNFDGYDIASPEPLTVSGDVPTGSFYKKAGKLSSTASGWLLAAPFSLDPNGHPVAAGQLEPYAGTFAIKAVVTESDPSNAKQRLEDAAELVGKEKEKIVALIPK